MEAQKVERSNAARYGVRRVSWQGIASSILLIIQIILLFSAVYKHKTVLVNFADIAGFEPAVDECLGGCLRLVIIAHA